MMNLKTWIRLRLSCGWILLSSGSHLNYGLQIRLSFLSLLNYGLQIRQSSLSLLNYGLQIRWNDLSYSGDLQTHCFGLSYWAGCRKSCSWLALKSIS